MIKTILIGAGTPLQETFQHLLSHTNDVNIVGWVGSDGVSDSKAMGGNLGPLGEARAIIERVRPEHVVLVFEPDRREASTRLVCELVGCSSEIWMVPDFFPPNSSMRENPGGDGLGIQRYLKLSPAHRLAKRFIDLLLAIPLILLALPLLSLIALAIRLDSPGPVIFKQPRVGEGGRLFGMFKFRTMSMEHVDPSGLEPKRPEDPRVTTVGRWLRQTSLDELPQLISVIRGEMSLVGPRPEVIANVAGYQPWQRERFAVPQGMTGWWQVQGRTQPMYAYTEQDLYYVRNCSLWLDLKILLMTPLAVLLGNGAY